VALLHEIKARAGPEEIMHELALAEAVVATAIEVAVKEGITEITNLEVRVGELQNIKKDVFEFALKEIIPSVESRISGDAISVVIEPAGFRCRPCGRAFSISDVDMPEAEAALEAIHFIPELAHSFLQCPTCGSPDFEVVQGRGVTIGTIEGE